eukprot:gene19041-biopygen14338
MSTPKWAAAASNCLSNVQRTVPERDEAASIAALSLGYPMSGLCRIAIAPKGVMLDTAAAIALQRDAIRMHAVLTHAMPPNNLTGMTLEERREVAGWLRNTKKE